MADKTYNLGQHGSDYRGRVIWHSNQTGPLRRGSTVSVYLSDNPETGTQRGRVRLVGVMTNEGRQAWSTRTLNSKGELVDGNTIRNPYLGTMEQVAVSVATGVIENLRFAARQADSFSVYPKGA